MQDLRKKELRRTADLFRGKCKISRYGILDLFKDCERMGYKLIRYPLGENADLGFAMKKEQDTIIFTNTCSRLSREIFTLAHEIGHVILHMEGSSSFIDNRMTITGKNMDEREQEANYFAACLLMPADDVDRFLDLEISDFEQNGLSAMDIARMMSEFSVSFDTALNRLENLGRIDNKQRIQLDNERIEKRVGNLLKSVGGNARLNIPCKEIYIPFEYIDYVIYNYNHNVIPLQTLEKALGYYQLTLDDISDRLVRHEADEEELDALIGGLED
ncbi:MAG: ImmA/IrrE family metallo-endopeptidase [Lachnospiraceae bacterium]|nr:ImmA/IrrE family metallo-endopeptidase [Lachnospiraceae bacterium]